MNDEILDDPELTPSGKPDFRRVGKRVPFVLNPQGKRTRYGSPSGVGKILDDETGLTNWKLRTTVLGAAQRPDLMAVVSTLEAKDKAQLMDIAEQCLVAGKGLERQVKGTAVHAMFDHLDLQDGWQPAPQWVGLCNSYLATLGQWGLVPVDVEIHCINHANRLAGTADRRYRTTKVLVPPDGSTIPIGSMLMGDTKTGQVVEYASGTYATQLAAYADSEKYDVVNDTWEPFDPPTYEHWAIIVHADSGSTDVQIYWVDLDAGREGLRLAKQVKGWRQRGDLLTLAAPAVATRAVEAPQTAPEAPSEASRLSGLLEHTRARVLAILGHSDVAGKSLQRNWPDGVPGLKAGTPTWDQLQAIVAACNRVEDEFNMPFPKQWIDPREQASRDAHPSNWQKRDPAPPVLSVVDAINQHPKAELLNGWVSMAVQGGIDHTINFQPLKDALLVFAELDEDGENLTALLDGCIRGMGYQQGIWDLGKVQADHAPLISQAAESIRAGTAALVYQEDGSAILRTNIVRGQ